MPVLLLVVISTLAACTAPTPPAGQTATLERVSDGDTIRVTLDGSTERVRILGINAPEDAHDDRPAECGAPEATTALRELLHGHRTVTLVTDTRADDRDRYGRLLRHLDLDGTDVALTLIEQGRVAAYVPASAPRPDRQDEYEHATAQARRTRAGSWLTCGDLTAH